MNAILHDPVSEQFREPGSPFLSPSRFADVFGYQLQEVAERAGVHRNTLRLRPGTQQLQAYLQGMVRVLDAATELTGDRDRAVFLIRNEPLRAFDRKTAAALVAEGRADDVVLYLESFAGGAAG